MSNDFFNHLDDKEIFAFGDLHGDIHALRLLLDLTESIDPPELGWDKLYEKVFAETDLHLNDLRSKSLYNIFGGFSDEIKKLFPKWKDGMEDKVIVVTGDMIDNLRGKYTKLDDSVTCHIGFVKQEELKIVLCLKILDYQAIQADRGCRVITLLGNHEDMNIKDINSDYFCQDDQFYYDGANFITRKDFFIIYHKIFNFEDGQKKIIFRVNNNIFMHGGMTSQIMSSFKQIFKQIFKQNDVVQMYNFIIITNLSYSSESLRYNTAYNYLNKILWDRDFGEPNNKTTVEICSEFNTMIKNFTNDDTFNLIVGHCVQSYVMYRNTEKEYVKSLNGKPSNVANKQFLRYFHSQTVRTKDKHVMSGTTEEKNILDSYDTIDSILDNPTIEFPSFIGINTTKCDSTDRIFRLDVGMSKAFDDEYFYKKFDELYEKHSELSNIKTDEDKIKSLKHDDFLQLLKENNPELHHYMKEQFFLLIKYVLSRAPQLLHITNTKQTKVFRASLTNTLKYMSRDNIRLIPSDEVKNILFLITVAYIDQAEISFNEFG